MFSKKAVVITTAAGTGMKSAIKDITNTLFYWGVPYIREYGIAVQAMSWEQVSSEKKAKINADEGLGFRGGRERVLERTRLAG